MKSLAILVALCGLAAADVHTNKVSKVSVDVPKTYKMTDKDDVIRGESADHAVAVFQWNVDTSDPAEAEKLLATELYSMIGSLQWDKPRSEKVNGLDATWIDGTGRSVGNTLDIRMILAGPTGAKKHVILATIVDHAKADAHKAEIAAILKSLKPAK
jgi:hypothetical protein